MCIRYYGWKFGSVIKRKAIKMKNSVLTWNAITFPHTSIQSCLFTSAFKTKKCNLILFIKIHQMIRDKIIIFFNPPKTNRKFIQYRIEKWKNEKVLACQCEKELIIRFVYRTTFCMIFVWLKFQLSFIIFIYGIIVSMVEVLKKFYSIKLNSMHCEALLKKL